MSTDAGENKMNSRFGSVFHIRNSVRARATAAGDEKLTAGVPLAKLIKRKLNDAPEIVMLSKPRSVGAEKFRRLKTVLTNESIGNPQVIVLTSGGPNEGKSFTALNLSLAFAADMRGEVLLLDADLRRPTVEKYLSPPPQLGLSELLRGKTELDHAVLSLENSPLKLLPAGDPPNDPSELLASDFGVALMSELRKRFARIIVDTPPIVPFTDADVIGSASDGILIVTRAGVSRTANYLQAVEAVTSTRILGTVLNDLTFSLADRDSYHRYEKNYYDYYDKNRAK
jgi:capsular exopolysaccharide synthesis family protein